MKTITALLTVIALLARPINLKAQQDYASKIKLETRQPFMYALKHFHIPGTAENQSDVTLGQIQIKGQAYGERAKLLSTAFGRVFAKTLKPGKTAAFDIEFLNIVGPDIAKVKDSRVAVEKAIPLR